MNNREFFNSVTNQNRKKWLNADSTDLNSNAGKRRTSNFFVIKIVNAGGSAINNVDIGDSYANRSASNFGQNVEITITSSIPGVSYREWLAQSESRPFNVGKTEFISSTPNQLNEVYTITHRNASGNVQNEVIQADLDPYQNQTDRVATEYSYLFDGFSRIRASSVLGNATLIIKIWPDAMYSATQDLAGRGDLETFSMPRVF